MKNILDDIKESKKVVCFFSENKVRWKGFESKEELFWWMQERIFRKYDNPIFQDIKRQVEEKGDIEPLSIDEKIAVLQSEILKLESLKKDLN